MTLQRVLYRSRASQGSQSMATMRDILKQSRRNNQREDLTGVLVVTGGSFLQALEGPEPGLDHLLARIKKDPRHHSFEILERRSVKSRIFGDWAMAGVRPHSSKSGELDKLLADDVDPGEAVSIMFGIAHDPLLHHF